MAKHKNRRRGKNTHHVFFTYPPEIFCRILSHLSIKDIAAMSQTSKWVYQFITPLKFNFELQMIKYAIRRHPPKKIINVKSRSSTYMQLRKKLTAALPHKKEFLRKIERVKNPTPGQDAMKGIAALVAMMGICSLPALGGELLDKAKVDISSYMFGLSGFDIGFGITMALLLFFSVWMGKVVADSQNKPFTITRPISLIDEASARAKLSAY